MVDYGYNIEKWIGRPMVDSTGISEELVVEAITDIRKT